MRKLIPIFFAILLLFSCNSSKEIIDVQNINYLTSNLQNNFIYSLPKTKIIIVVQVEKIIQNKGPFADFTDKYLGALNNMIKQNETFWNISDVSFLSYPVIDTLNTYVIGCSENLFLPLSLTKDGFPIAYNNSSEKYQYEQLDLNLSGLNDDHSQNLSFNFVSSDKSYKVTYDTVYKEEIYDTIIRRVPILKPNLVKKTPEEQAKELADRITILRDDRAALLVGEADNDNLPSGDALKIMLNEIDKLETEYLSMFVGRSDTLTYTFTFSYTPENSVYQQSIILFKFSQSSGLLPADNIYGTPVYFQIASNNKSTNISNYNYNSYLLTQVNKKSLYKGLYYRIPQQATVKLVFNSQIISEKNMYIAQHGTVQFLPANIFKNPNLKIKFYPELGSIESISF
ncbi:MAG: DUF4831 family protein [Bacteroidales bacterium]|nr:DUF4831 family protein [Bacteroidales bacterium]